MKTRRVVPVFVSGFPCPHRCVYCDQAGQTGVSAPPTPARVREALRAAGPEGEIAFYGGTFTALPPERQAALLAPVREALDEGRLAAARVSTHPLCCDEGRLEHLREAGVSLVELGVQSFDDEVLRRSGRGVDAAGVRAAIRRVRAAGLGLGLQLLPGLPGASRASDAESGRLAAAESPELARVYPALVLRGTALAEDWAAGRYEPLSLDEAVARAADQVNALEGAGARVQRVGLHVDAALRAAFLAGPLDDALGERVRAEIRYRSLHARALDLGGRGRLAMEVPARELSQWLGWRRENLARFARDFPDVELGIRVAERSARDAERRATSDAEASRSVRRGPGRAARPESPRDGWR